MGLDLLLGSLGFSNTIQAEWSC
ncbi:hypothetical protein HaLaN_04719, partial [Haematococcus lacustris]